VQGWIQRDFAVCVEEVARRPWVWIWFRGHRRWLGCFFRLVRKWRVMGEGGFGIGPLVLKR
jgi:hypothetical protein